MVKNFVQLVRDTYNSDEFIPLHEPRFRGNEKKHLEACIDSGFVSSVGQYVTEVEGKIAQLSSSNRAVACVNGTSALHAALEALDVNSNDEVITQAFTFVATGNAIRYTGAQPIFVDISETTLGMDPLSLNDFLDTNAEIRQGKCYNKVSNKKIAACIPMHSFGFPCEIEEIASICNKWNIALIEDAAESLGSYVGDKHTGTFGIAGTLSFNGNKVITCGGGGFVLTNDGNLADKLKHITTTAKVPHPWNYVHDRLGFNYRMPNLNAALLAAQLEMLPTFLKEKRDIATLYREFFSQNGIKFRDEREGTTANFWLNTIEFDNKKERDHFLKETNDQGIMTRPPWRPLNELEMFKKSAKTDLSTTLRLADLLVNIPSSAFPK